MLGNEKYYLIIMILGTGVIILIVVWSLTLAVFLFTIKKSGPAVLGGVGAVLASTIFTVILCTIPRGEDDQQIDPSAKYDTGFVGRVALLVLDWIMVTVGMAAVAGIYLLEQQHAEHIKDD